MKAIVTGHTKGLGAAITRQLLARGVPVLGLARGSVRSADALTQVALDLSDSAALGAWLAGSALADYLAGAELVLLVNNAGMVSPVGALRDQDPAAVIRAVSLNVAAPLALAAAVARACPDAQRRILHISSGAARHAYPGWSVYCATKAALDQHARAVALDGEARTRICSLAPGVIDTAMQAEIRAMSKERFALRERFVQMKEQGMLTAPEAAARAVVDYLLCASFGDKPVDDVRD
jgi:hypothetical protein